MKKLVLLIFLFIPLAAISQQKGGKVILIGIDAMSTDGFQTARIPNLMELVRNGAISIHSRGVMPTVSSPNWEAILTGVGPEQNGVTKNGWKLNNRTIQPAVADKEGYFPSVFTVIRQSRPEAKTAMFYDWPDLGVILNTKDITHSEFDSSTEEVYTKAISYIVTEKPDLAFVYTKKVDAAGHGSGHGTPEYLAAIEEVDRNIGRLLDAVKKAGVYSEYTFIVVADHGGVGKGHGGESMAEIEVPWIIEGPGIIRNAMISQPNDNFNTTPTIAYILGIKAPDYWIGRVVYGAFEGNEASRLNNRIFIPRPSASVKSGLYTGDEALVLSSSIDGAEIRYSLNGISPNPESILYTKPVELTSDTEIRAKAFIGGNESEDLVIRYTRIGGIKDLVLKDEASAKYPGNGPLSLVDGINATADYHDPAWMGFQGKNLEATIDFGAERKIKNLAVTCLSHESSWIYLPVRVEFYGSEDGVNFSLISKGVDKTMSMIREGIHSYSAAFPEIRTRYLKVIVYNIGVCPPGTPGQGEKAWLFVDEITISD